MLARCARVAPARVRTGPASLKLISSFLSACATDTPGVSGRLSEPLAPLIVTDCGALGAVTPAGSSTGDLAILDIATSGDDAQHFAALAGGARLAIAHHPLGRRDDHRSHAAEHLRQLV